MEIDALKFLELQSYLLSGVEGFDSVFLNKKTNLTIKDKFILFLLNENLAPRDLIKLLGVAKTNLALISQDLLRNGLIEKQKDEFDHRLIKYSLTESGTKQAKSLAEKINLNAKNLLEFKNKNIEINETVEKLLWLLK